MHYNYGNFSINNGQNITQYIGSGVLPENEEQAKELERLRQELRALGGDVSMGGRDQGIESQIANGFNSEGAGALGENRQRGVGFEGLSSENSNMVSLSILHSWFLSPTHNPKLC